MKPFLVTWEMEIDAEDPMQAAETAQRILRDPTQTWAERFSVLDESGQSTEIYLDADAIGEDE